MKKTSLAPAANTRQYHISGSAHPAAVPQAVLGITYHVMPDGVVVFNRQQAVEGIQATTGPNR